MKPSVTIHASDLVNCQLHNTSMAALCLYPQASPTICRLPDSGLGDKPPTTDWSSSPRIRHGAAMLLFLSFMQTAAGHIVCYATRQRASTSVIACYHPSAGILLGDCLLPAMSTLSIGYERPEVTDMLLGVPFVMECPCGCCRVVCARLFALVDIVVEPSRVAPRTCAVEIVDPLSPWAWVEYFV